jgi:hypothetical protein
MARTFLIGIAAAVIGAIGLMIGGALGIEFTNTMLGVGGGLILGMVRLGSPLGRLGGYFIGLLLGVLFAALQLGLIPGGASAWGAIIAIGIVLIVIALVSGFTRNHVSSWSMLLGALVFMSGFIATTQSTPWTANIQVVSFFLATLVMSAIGFLVVIVVELVEDLPALQNYGHHFDAEPPTGDPVEPTDQTHNVETNLQGIVGDTK